MLEEKRIKIKPCYFGTTKIFLLRYYLYLSLNLKKTVKNPFLTGIENLSHPAALQVSLFVFSQYCNSIEKLPPPSSSFC